jgi:MoaA/NifB/PqqE/SkfB family radical SAM enzyme
VASVQPAIRLLRNIVGTRFGYPRPLLALWETTYRCNMRCCFCNEKGLSTPELDTRQALTMIEQLAHLGTSVVLLTGGEPTLRRDLAPILDAIADCGMASILCTNGSGVMKNPRAILRSDMIRLSVDGYGALHDEIRGAPGAFGTIGRCVPLLVDAGHAPVLTTVVTTRSTRDNLSRLMQQARDWRVCVDLSMVVCSNRTGDVLESASPPAEAQASCRVDERVFLDWMTYFRNEFPDVVANPKSYDRLVERGGIGRGCRALDVGLNIKPDGTVSVPCDAFALRRLRGDLGQIWSELTGLHELKRNLGTYAFCANCYKRCVAVPSMLLTPYGFLDVLLSYGHAYAIPRHAWFSPRAIKTRIRELCSPLRSERKRDERDERAAMGSKTAP